MGRMRNESMSFIMWRRNDSRGYFVLMIVHLEIEEAAEIF